MTLINWIGLSILLATGSVVFFKLYRSRSVVRKTRLTPDEINELEKIFHAVNNYMYENEAFLKKSIKLTEMAVEIGVKEKLLSRAINHFKQENFNAYINNLRIEYSKKLIESGKLDHYTIEAIADECGFSNKVSFYQAFKSNTGMSPKEFKALKQS